MLVIPRERSIDHAHHHYRLLTGLAELPVEVREVAREEEGLEFIISMSDELASARTYAFQHKAFREEALHMGS